MMQSVKRKVDQVGEYKDDGNRLRELHILAAQSLTNNFMPLSTSKELLPQVWACHATQAEIDKKAEELQELGYVVHPLMYNQMHNETITKKLCQGIEAAIEVAPEFVKTRNLGDDSSADVPMAERPSAGGFGAINYNTPNYCNTARLTRLLAFENIKVILRRASPGILQLGSEPHIRCLYDRVLCRVTGQSASRESWHRDGCTAEYVERVPKPDHGFATHFGGWVSLHQHQSFCCVPGSHVDPKWMGVLQPDGFDKIPVSDHGMYKAKSKTVKVPEGSQITFFAHIVHCVSGGKVKAGKGPIVRVFHGAEVGTKSTLQALMGDTTAMAKALTEGSYAVVKSGQAMVMYPQLYWTNHPTLLSEFSSQMASEMLVTRQRRSKGVVTTMTVPNLTAPAASTWLTLPPLNEKEQEMFLTIQKLQPEDTTANQ